MSLLLSQQGWAASAALLEGADTLLAQVSPVVAVNSAVADGADVLQAQISPVVALNAALTDGADVLAASVALLTGVDFSAALADGADVLTAALDVPTKQGGDDVPRVEVWTSRKARTVRKRLTRELVALRTTAPDLADAITVPSPQPDWRAYVAQLQAVSAQLEAIQADWLEQDDEELLLLLS